MSEARRRGSDLPNASVISVIDDDMSARRATARLLHSLGHEVASFASAEEFLESGRLDETACVVSDVRMPGMSGVELQSRLRAEGRRLPIIFISAYPESSARSRALAAGAVAVLDKPFSDDELICCIDQALAPRA
jgi:FixJ family two-component response regulator